MRAHSEEQGAIRVKMRPPAPAHSALSEYLSRHAPGRVTETLDRLCGEIAGETDRFVAEASRRVLERTEW